MEQFHLPSNEETRVAYQQGEEAILVLFHQTFLLFAITQKDHDKPGSTGAGVVFGSRCGASPLL
jgi:hypothetical protein